MSGAASRDTILMCEPSYFSVSYDINPWMTGNVQNSDLGLAKKQWNELHDAISKVADVKVMDGQPGLPDMVFTANAGTVLRKLAVLSRFKHPERKGEEVHFQKFFSDNGFHLVVPPTGVEFEGAGDVLMDRCQSIVWMGHGHRTSIEFLPMLRDYYYWKAVVPLELVDDRFYHLDTCFCPLNGGYVMYYPGAFSEGSLKSIKTWVPVDRRIEIGEDDALKFACNAVNVKMNVFLNAASDGLATVLSKKGFTVTQVVLSEFMKSGGAAKCLTLKLNEG